MKLSTVAAFKNINHNQEGLIRIEGETLKRYQEVLLGIADDIIKVCDEHRVTYHLTGGSALGAVRHKGFIPWDDDMDIDILGTDFDRFVEAFREEFGDKYWIHTCHSEEYGMTINRVRLKNSVCRGREDVDNEECGFFIDLMRIENVPDSKLLRNIHGTVCMGMGFLLSCRNFYKNRELMLKLADGDAELMKTFRLKIAIGRLLRGKSVKWWAERTQRWYGLCRNRRSRYVSVPAGRKHYFGEMIERDKFVKTRNAEFAGRTWRIPADYDFYLTHMYGDYMQIPPEDKREAHVVLELKFPEEE